MKKTKTNNKSIRGLSILEVLIVILVFSVLGVLTTQAIFLTLKGTKKSSSLMKVRENVSYSLDVIERQLRNAQSVTPCPNTDTKIVSYIDADGKIGSFSCTLGETTGYIASGSARLTSDEIKITACSFNCVESLSGNPPSVAISLSAEDALAKGLEKGKVTSSTQIFLRTY